MNFRFPMTLVFGVLLATACTSKTTDTSDTDVTDTDVADTDVEDTDLESCDNATDTDSAITCNECIACTAPVSCTTAYNTCQANADCAALFTCIVGCADDTCIGVCFEDHGAGQTVLGPLQECVIAACPNSCVITDPT